MTYEPVQTEKKKTGPSINRHRSKQDYRTPPDFMAAVRERFGSLAVDLAANDQNHQAEDWVGWHEGWFVNSLGTNWHDFDGLLWLNPPYSDIAPWARKCSIEAEAGARILFLVPASVDANWWAEYVHCQAAVLFLSPRLSFDGANPYPKPCALCCYGFNLLERGLHWYDPWRWR